MKVSILIPSRTPALVTKAVESILTHTKGLDYNILIHDNSTEKLRSGRMPVSIYDGEFVSFSHSNNMLARQSTADILVLCNDDIVLTSDAIGNMVKTLVSDPIIGVVGARLLFPSGSIQHAGVSFKAGMPVHLFHNLDQNDFIKHDREFQCVTGALMACWKKDYDKVGGLCEDYINGWEDTDFCFRIRYMLEKKVVYCSSAIATHNEAATRKPVGGIHPKFNADWRQVAKNDFDQFYNWSHGLYGLSEKSSPFTDKDAMGFSIVCVSNKRHVLESHLLRSLQKQKGTKFDHDIVIVESSTSASEALNRGIEQAKHNIVLMPHQDYILSEDFLVKLEEKTHKYPCFGVMGNAGVDTSAAPVGGFGGWADIKEGTVQTLDECILIIRKDSGLRFDERFTWHCYGADLCMQSANRHLPVVSLDIGGCHPHNPGKNFKNYRATGYWENLGKLLDKWYKPIELTHAAVNRMGIKTKAPEQSTWDQ